MKLRARISIICLIVAALPGATTGCVLAVVSCVPGPDGVGYVRPCNPRPLFEARTCDVRARPDGRYVPGCAGPNPVSQGP